MNLMDAIMPPPIELFRIEYGNVSGLLRERSVPDAHPKCDHAWHAARIANKVGLYYPCVSFEQDYSDAVQVWEARNSSKNTAVEGTVLDKPGIDEPALNIFGEPVPRANPANEFFREQKRCLDMFIARQEEQALSVVLGIMAARKIVAATAQKTASANRGRRLFKRSEERRRRKEAEEMARKQKEEEAAMLADFTRGSEPEVLSNELLHGDSSSFLQVDGTYTAKNGEAMVNSNSTTKLYNMWRGK
jgi:hypothetical protein